MSENDFFSLDDIERIVGFKGQYVFYRAGFDCLDKKTGEIKDPTRIEVLAPSIQRLSESGARVVIYSHNGRPEGKIVDTLRMDTIGAKLSELGIPNQKLDDCVGEEVEKAVRAMKDSDVILTENVRFHPLSVSKEPADIEKLAQELAFGGGLFKIYVNAAWPVSHRESADMTGVVKYINYACADPQVTLEYRKAMKIITNPRRPYVAIIGGEKPDKTKEVPEIIKKVDKLIAAGVFANSIFCNKSYNEKVEKVNVQGSKKDDSTKTQDMITELLSKYRRKVVLPIDVIATDNFEKPTKHDTYELGELPEGYVIVGIGPKTIRKYKDILKKAGTVAWAGPFDVYENPDFRAGTEEIGYFLADGTNANVLICGGDTGDAAHELGFAEKLLAAVNERKIHLSTGGGVNLPLLAGKDLPAISALRDNYRKHR